MTATRTPTRREKPPVGGESPDIPRIHALHLQASQYDDELREQARRLITMGKVRAARTIEKKADKVDERLQALEAEVRLASRMRT